MPKIAKELGPLQVQRLAKVPGRHAVGGVAGLHPLVEPTGAAGWILRVVIGGRRRDMGLGGFPSMTLAGAREAARKARDKVREDVDPIEAGKAARSALAASRAAEKTFRECARLFIEAKAPEFRNGKHLGQWTSTLESYAYPVIGHLLVRDVALPHIVEILEPLWTTKTETATRLRQRLEAVLDWATVRGYRSGENPARWKGHLDKLLPKPTKVAKVKHHPAVPWREMPAFMERLRAMPGMGARALGFVALTAARSGEVRLATWSEIDLDAAIWVVPADHMKAGREHKVPLSKPAIRLLKSLPRGSGDDLVFPSTRPGRPLSDMTLSSVMRRMEVDAVPHGLRSTFRDFVGESTNFPRELAEAALAHVVGGVEGAYARGDLFERRRRVMEAYAAFCASPPASRGKVVAIRG